MSAEREQTSGAGSLIWHDIECGAYEADLPLWEELAEQAVGPVLELGCGSGRVGLHLARRGHVVTAVDLDPELLAAAAERGAGLPFEALQGDARDLSLEARFGLVLAPMQLIQMVGGEGERRACLEGIARHLQAGGLAAAAIVEEMPDPSPGPPPLPDVREVGGWVYSSLPLDAAGGDEWIDVRRLRQTVSPDGELREECDDVRIAALGAAALEREASSAGLRPAGRRTVPATDAHVGSTVVLLERDG